LGWRSNAETFVETYSDLTDKRDAMERSSKEMWSMSSSSDQDGHAVRDDGQSPDQGHAGFPTARHPMAEACVDLGSGLAAYGIEQSGAEVGQAMERCAGREPEGGYRVDLYGLPCAMEGEGRAEPGVYARLVSADEVGRTSEGTERLVLQKTSEGN
jgi:hypothetical protein